MDMAAAVEELGDVSGCSVISVGVQGTEQLPH